MNAQEGDEFVAAANTYVRKFLRRGVTSLFSDLKPLYKQSGKAALLGTLFERILASLRTNGAFPEQPDSQSPAQGRAEAEPAAEDSAPSGSEPPAAEGPQAELWTTFYLAQHYDRMGRTGNLCCWYCFYISSKVQNSFLMFSTPLFSQHIRSKSPPPRAGT